MSCMLPPALNDDQISAALDDQAPADVRTHLDQCPSCRERFEAARRFEEQLTLRLHRFQCPTSQQLQEFVLNLAEAAAVVAHVQNCPRCQQEIEDFQGFMQTETAPITAAPSRLPARHRPAPQVLPLRYALRGSAPVMLEVDGVTLILSTQMRDDVRWLMGRLMADNPSKWRGALVQLRQQDVFQTSVLVDVTGAFRCRLRQDTPVTLRITAHDRTVLRVEQIELEF